MNDANISSDPEQQQLMERFPRLFRGAQPAVWSHVPAGWKGIVGTLFNGIDALLDDEQAKSFRVEQIKEKFGTLRLYLSFDRIDTAGVSPNPTELRDLVDAAVAASEVTCYVCGAPGEMRNLGAWATVRCDAHAVCVQRGRRGGAVAVVTWHRHERSMA